MSRKPKRPVSPDPAIRSNPFLAKSNEDQLRALKPFQRRVVTTLWDLKTAQLQVFLELIARSAAQSDTPAQAKTGRARDLRLDRAANAYIALVKYKDELRAQGYRGLHDDQRELDRVADMFFPECKQGTADEYRKTLQRIKYAVNARRSKTLG